MISSRFQMFYMLNDHVMSLRSQRSHEQHGSALLAQLSIESETLLGKQCSFFAQSGVDVILQGISKPLYLLEFRKLPSEFPSVSLMISMITGKHSKLHVQIVAFIDDFAELNQRYNV